MRARLPSPLRTRLLALALCGTLLLAGSGPPPDHPVNLNTATVTELLQLPRVGPKTAQRIIAFRQEHGPFQRPEDLMNVKGIGEKTFQKLRPFITVDGGEP
ncbi:MAG: helix-hairpin-helix domain-containing protein [Holophaga sp.]|nr:helix-hairpin-helix domain-containing protein [Holophaga sp.]